MNKIHQHSLHDDIGYWLGRLKVKVKSAFEAKLLTKEISIPQWCIIISLYNGDAASIMELSKFIEIDKASISRVADQLEEMGIIIRGDGKDRRSGSISLSQKGEQLAPQLARLAELNEREFFSTLSNIEKKQLKNILKKLLQHAGIKNLSGWLVKK